MRTQDLFGVLSIKLPASWTVEVIKNQVAKGQPQALEAEAFDASESEDAETAIETGHLNIKCYQFEIKDEQQQAQLLTSVYAETDKEQLSENVFWGLEELRGEEEGDDVAIMRWLVSSMQNSAQFTLVIFNYSVSADAMSSESVSEEIQMLEESIKYTEWS